LEDDLHLAFTELKGDMPSQPKVAVYARVSTDEQSPDAQLRDLREYVHNRGWKQFAEYIDVGESGSKDSRPAWNELWEAIRRRKVNVVIIPALDRLGRSLPHLVKILCAINDAEISLISLREGFDLNTAVGRLQANLLAVLSEYELSLIRERTKAGMRAARARGSQIGPRKNYLCPRKATELLDQGVGQIKIAKALGVGVGRVNQFVHEQYVPAKQRQKLASSVAVRESGD
jgi:DNA invertase Pin-like site-specific DNA recombinase